MGHRLSRAAVAILVLGLASGCASFLTFGSNAALGNLSTVRRMADAGYPINKRERKGVSPLMMAAYKGRVEVVRYLLSKGAEVNVIDDLWRTPLMYACAAGHADVTRLLLDAGANPAGWDYQGASAMNRALTSGSLETVKVLMAKGVSIDDRTKGGSTALASFPEHLAKFVPEVVALGADPNARDANGFTPLMGCAYMSRPKVARALIAAGADPHARTVDGQTALSIARKNRKPDVRKLLEEAGVRE